MEVALEIIKYILPAGLVLLVTYMLLSSFMDNEEKRRMYYLRKEAQKHSTLARLQAYERVTMLLERITPNSLFVRVSATNLSVQAYQKVLLKAIRDEFEHNLSQQIYISDEAWRLVKAAKSSTISIINKAVMDLDPRANGSELSKKILTATMDFDKFPTRRAIDVLKQEVRRVI